MSRIFTICKICKILGGPVIGNLSRGLPKRCRCDRNLILEEGRSGKPDRLDRRDPVNPVNPARICKISKILF